MRPSQVPARLLTVVFRGRQGSRMCAIAIRLPIFRLGVNPAHPASGSADQRARHGWRTQLPSGRDNKRKIGADLRPCNPTSRGNRDWRDDRLLLLSKKNSQIRVLLSAEPAVALASGVVSTIKYSSVIRRAAVLTRA
jgi:hypothetical protein